jgi:maleylacetoacetate isomerase
MGLKNEIILDKIILYSYFRSSASYRVRLGLALKELPYVYHGVHLLKEGGLQKKADYAALNPMKHVPTLIHRTEKGDFVLSESMAILKYLDAVKETPLLFPKDPQKEARVLQLCEVINSGIQPLQNLKVQQYLVNNGLGEEGKKRWTLHWVTEGLKALDLMMEKTAGTHAVGDAWSAADCLLIAQVFSSERVGVTLEAFPTLKRVYEKLKDHPAVTKAHPAHQPDSE